MNRYYQLASWILAAPLFGAIQAIASMFPVMRQHGDLGNPDLLRIMVGLALVYGSGWFIPALLVSDLVILKRTLSGRDLAWYTSGISISALVIGLLLPRMMVMLAYPLTACAILLCGFWHRKKPRAVPAINPTAK
jgi:hypothetical protein